MARKFVEINRFWGISDGDKEGIRSSYIFGRSIDFRSDPHKLTILPRTTKASGTTVVDLPLWADRYSTDIYLYGNAGHIYKKTSADVWTDLRTVSDSHGNGLAYYGEDDYIYYPSDTVIGRYGRMGSSPTFVDDWLGAEGGIPLNTASLDLERGSEQYADAADHASLSQTGDITIELSENFESLPAVDSVYTFVSKWNESGNQRSYSFDLKGISGYFGDGGDSSLTISSNTTQAPIDASCSGTAAAYTLSATNVSFATGQKILIHQTRGTNAGVWERNEIAGYTAGTITLTTPLTNTFTDSGASQAQVIVLLEYTNVTVNAGITWTAKAWDGDVGGILTFLASGTVTVNGTITASGKGYRGGTAQSSTNVNGKQGEGNIAAGDTNSTSANGNGAGGGYYDADNARGRGGTGGGHATDGTLGGGYSATPGTSAGSADLTTMVFGGGGGSGGRAAGQGGTFYDGGDGGGAIFIIGTDIVVDSAGTISSNGGDGTDVATQAACGGGGAGGSILLKAQTATLGTTRIVANGGTGGTNSSESQQTGGDGSVGRIHLDYYTSYTGTTTPTLDVVQDNTLVTNTSYQLRLGISSTGTNEEFLTKTLSADPVTGQWNRWAVTFDASASTAEFFKDAVSLGTSTGTLTAINDSTALFAIGAVFDSGGDDADWFDGKLDDIRLWSDIRTDAELAQYKETQLGGSEANLVAYWKVNSSTADDSSNSNTLTLRNSATYDTTDVPFSSPTTRQDIDQQLNTSGQTYTLPTAIDEGDTHRQTFIPAKDPQKSIEVLIAAVGTGDWTLTVHDAQNRTIATKTVTNANLNTGDYEFVFASVWRPIIGASYHFHLTSTVNDGTVTTTTASDLETVDFHTYYQFLVEYDWHPALHIFEKIVFGNERYLATWDAATYSPHRLTLPSGYKIRCLGKWREYLVMGVVLGTNIEDYDYGYLFFWDGTSDTYNYYLPISQGGINAILSGDPMYFVAGYSGDLMRYPGGSPARLRRIPKMTELTKAEVYPGALTMWRSLVRIGFAGSTDSSDIEHGVYTWGSGLFSDRLEEVLSYDYPLSNFARKGTTIAIGLVYPTGSNLLIGWKSGSSYGVDIVKPTNPPFLTATYESLITDINKVWGEKTAHYFRSYFKAIASGDFVTTKWKVDRNSDWTSGSVVSTTGEKTGRDQVPTQSTRFNEIQIAIDLATSNTTSPEFYAIALEVDSLVEEQRV